MTSMRFKYKKTKGLAEVPLLVTDEVELLHINYLFFELPTSSWQATHLN